MNFKIWLENIEDIPTVITNKFNAPKFNGPPKIHQGLIALDAVMRKLDIFGPDHRQGGNIIGTPEYMPPEQYGLIPKGDRMVYQRDIILNHEPNAIAELFYELAKKDLEAASALQPLLKPFKSFIWYYEKFRIANKKLLGENKEIFHRETGYMFHDLRQNINDLFEIIKSIRNDESLVNGESVNGLNFKKMIRSFDIFWKVYQRMEPILLNAFKNTTPRPPSTGTYNFNKDTDVPLGNPEIHDSDQWNVAQKHPNFYRKPEDPYVPPKPKKWWKRWLDGFDW